MLDAGFTNRAAHFTSSINYIDTYYGKIQIFLYSYTSGLENNNTHSLRGTDFSEEPVLHHLGEDFANLENKSACSVSCISSFCKNIPQL